MKRIFALALCLTSANVSLADKVEKIIVENNKRIEASTIENYLYLKKGDEVTSEAKQKSIHSLFDTSLFEDVKITYKDGALNVFVEEMPLIVKVVIKGNGKIGTKTINKAILTQQGHSLKNRELELDVQKILEIYKKSGRFSASVDPKIENLKSNRVKVVFNITEGPKTTVKQIRFIGNRHYRDNLLKATILTKEKAWWRFLSSDDAYDPDRMDYDQVLLSNFYHSAGYADFKIISSKAELAPTKDHFILTYAFEEGVKYNFGSSDLQNNLKNVSSKELLKMISLPKKKTYNNRLIERIEDQMSNWLADKGYPQANVYHVLDKDPKTQIVNVKFVIDDSEKVFIKNINIKGNLKTHDNVIRREFKIQEGDIFNRTHIEKGDRNLRLLNYFESVRVKPTPTNDPKKYDLDVEVQEKSTTSIGLEGGYNTSSGPFGRVSFEDRNLLGTGKYLNSGVQVAKRNTSYNFGITDPYFMGRDLSLGTSLFYSHSGSGHASQLLGDSNPYTLNTKGAKVSLGYDVKDDLHHNIFYTVKKEDLSVSKAQHSLFIREQIGKFTTSAVGHSFTFNKLDNNYTPKSGYLASISQEFAGLGGNNKYIKHEASVSKYKSFYENSVTLKLSAEAGVINGIKKHKVRINDRFNLGDQTLRGFGSRGIGPADKRTKEHLGGKKYYAASAELQFPIGAPEEFSLLGATFIDIGGVWDIDIKKNSLYTKKDIRDNNAPRISYGLGLVWNTRMAPIKLYYGFRLRKQKYDEVQPWTISLSTAF